MILDKLPEIEASYYTSNKRSYTGISDRIEDCSTALNTTQSVAAAQDREANGTAYEEVDGGSNKENEEENYLEWRAKKLDYLKLPVCHPPPRSTLRSFSTDKRKKKVRASAETGVSLNDECEKMNKLNKTA